MTKRHDFAFVTGSILVSAGAVVVCWENGVTTKMLIGLALESIGILMMTWFAFGREIKRFVNARIFKIRCPDCDGTGICHQKNPEFPHSCCNPDCGRIEVPASAVPAEFNRGYRAKDGTVTIGSGFLDISLFRFLRELATRGRNAFPRRSAIEAFLAYEKRSAMRANR